MFFLEWIEAHERMARWFILMDHRMQADVDYVGGILKNDDDDDDNNNDDDGSNDGDNGDDDVDSEDCSYGDGDDSEDDFNNVVHYRSCPTEW